MRFISTRGSAPPLSFSDAVLTGLARDGGLYVPESWPHVDPEAFDGPDVDYLVIAHSVISRFMAADPEAPTVSELMQMLKEAYATFRHPSIAPLVEIGPGRYVLELFHGPTLAFKDVAMQFLARLMDYLLAKRGERATIVGATSGDTGSAAIEAFRGRDNIDIFVLHPEGRTSEVQRRQMTTVLDGNVHNIAIQGTFDDCQNIVKAMFNNQPFRDRVRLSGVNSINWGRIVAQIPYYFKAAGQLGATRNPVVFSVPTGNFGDIFAGYAAKRMGLPIAQLLIATNSNDILRRALEGGVYETVGVMQTSSPSMDIQVSSNFERLLFEASGRDGAAVTAMMRALGQSGAFTIPDDTLEAIRDVFLAGTADEAQTRAASVETLTRTGYLLDPHSAVGVSVAEQLALDGTVVSLATAHPAKFPAAVKAATGVEPALPSWLADLYQRPERFDVLANDQAAVEAYVLARTRVEE